MTGLASLLDLAETGLWTLALVFFRVGAAMAVLPALGEQVVSVRIRLLLGLVLSLAIAPQAPFPDPGSPGSVAIVGAILTESLNGLVLGIFLRLFVLALQTAGSIAAQATSLAQLLGNTGTDPMPAVGHILTVSGLALLMATGFHVKAATFLILSYDILPPLEFPSPAAVAEAGRERVSQSFSLAFGLAAPFVILSTLYNLTLGFINKAMPQLMVAFVGAPVITLGSVALLMLAAPAMLSVWLAALDGFLSNPFR